MPSVVATPPQDQGVALRRILHHALASGEMHLPVLPRVTGRVMTVTQDPNADLVELSDLIHQDQSLAGNVLRIANSAVYCAGEPIVSLRQAVMQLGLATLGEIALAACLQSQALSAPGHGQLQREMFAHAFVSAGFAKELARCRRDNVEVAFLCGLLHRIGLTVALGAIARLETNPANRLNEADALALAREFEPLFAAAVTVAWKLPPEVQAVALHHHAPEQAPTFMVEAKLTALAGSLARSFLQPDDAAAESLPTLPAWADLNLYPDDVAAVLARGKILTASIPAFGGGAS